MKRDLDHGDECPECHEGVMEEAVPEGCCSCHISPPCSFCLTQRFVCDVCGHEVVYGD